MSLLSDLYRMLHKRRLGHKCMVLSRGAQDELLCLLTLWPLFACDLRRPPAPFIVASDATKQRGAVVWGPVTAEEATWLWARLQRRAGAQSWLSPEGVLEVANRTSPDEDLESFINSHDLTVALNFKFRYEQHINVQEAVAVRVALKLMARRVEVHGSRVPILVDSLVVQSVLSKGRSCSRPLNKVVRSIAMIALFANLQLLTGWIRSEANPSDDPTRLASLRTPLAREETLIMSIRQVACEWAYPFQATLQMWHDKGWDHRHATRLFDTTLGFPGEGPRLSWAGQKQDLRDTDLRVRVQPGTVKRYGVRLQMFLNWAVENQLAQGEDLQCGAFREEHFALSCVSMCSTNMSAALLFSTDLTFSRAFRWCALMWLERLSLLGKCSANGPSLPRWAPDHRCPSKLCWHLLGLHGLWVYAV
eukprot:3541450-Amphidinium_carterae.2